MTFLTVVDLVSNTLLFFLEKRSEASYGDYLDASVNDYTFRQSTFDAFVVALCRCLVSLMLYRNTKVFLNNFVQAFAWLVPFGSTVFTLFKMTYVLSEVDEAYGSEGAVTALLVLSLLFSLLQVKKALGIPAIVRVLKYNAISEEQEPLLLATKTFASFEESYGVPMKTIVITGSTRGIGFGLAKEFLKRGCNVMVSSRKAEAVDAAVRELASVYGSQRVHGAVCDVFRYGDVQSLWDAAVVKFSRVDVWINNAGMSPAQVPLWKTSPKEMATATNTNVIGLLYGCQVAIRGMQTQEGVGQIYNMEGFGSQGQLESGLTHYGSTKKAVDYITKSLIAELKKEPINVQIGTLSPGIVVTDLLISDIGQAYTAEKWKKVKKIFNILADTTDNVSKFLVEGVLANESNGARIAFLTTGEAMKRFMTAGFNKRDLFSHLDIQTSAVDHFAFEPQNPSPFLSNTTASTTVVITGSTRGIGLGLATEFLKCGCRVMISGRNVDAVNDIVAKFRSQYGESNVSGISCDVTKFEDVKALWDAAVAAFGGVHIWINNAGTTTTPLPLWKLEPDQIATTISCNLTGTLYGCSVAAKGMLTQGGGQIYNVEGLGSKGELQKGLTCYGCTKAGVAYISKSLRTKELKTTAVQICTIRPGINVTDHLVKDAHVLGKKRWEETKKVFNILGDKVETTTPWLVANILQNKKNGAEIAWLTPGKITKRFLCAPCNPRDLFADMEDDMV